MGEVACDDPMTGWSKPSLDIFGIQPSSCPQPERSADRRQEALFNAYTWMEEVIDDFHIPYPFDFVIGGTPVSLHTKNAKAKQLWQEKVGQRAQLAINSVREQYFLDDRPLMVTILLFSISTHAG